MKTLLSLRKKTSSPHFIGFFCASCLYFSVASYLIFTTRSEQISIKQEGNHSFTLSLQSLQDSIHPKKNTPIKQPTKKIYKTQPKPQKPKDTLAKEIAKPLPPTPPKPNTMQEEKSLAKSKQTSTQNTQETLKHNEGVSHEFLAKIHSLISSHNPYPRMARRQRLEGEVVVEFILDPSGIMSEAKIVYSNAKEILQKSALKALHKASKFFPLPQKRVKIQVPILYKLH